MKLFKTLITICAILLIGGHAFGATYCLSNSGDGTAPTGSDPDHCWDITDLAGAGGTLAAGDTITAIYSGGTIIGQVTPPAVDGTAESPITITIDQAGTSSVPNFKAAAGSSRAINLHSRSHYVLKGIDAENKMFIDGNAKASAVTGANGTGITVQYVDAFNTTAQVVYGTNVVDYQVLDSDLHNCNADGAYIDGASSTRFDGNYIYDINNLATDGDCLQLVGGEALTGSSYSHEITDNILIKDTIIKNNVYVTSTGSILISGNTLTGPGAAAGYCAGIVPRANGYTITDNTITDSERGIFVYNSSGTGTITKNILDDNQDGFYIDSTAVGTVNIHNNTIDGVTNLLIPATAITVDYKNNISMASTRHISDAGTGTRVFNNNDYTGAGDWYIPITTYATLELWQAASSDDANSIAVDPQLTATYSSPLPAIYNGGTDVGLTWTYSYLPIGAKEIDITKSSASGNFSTGD
jgi:parallel beta-helix repeat protein